MTLAWRWSEAGMEAALAWRSVSRQRRGFTQPLPWSADRDRHVVDQERRGVPLQGFVAGELDRYLLPDERRKAEGVLGVLSRRVLVGEGGQGREHRAAARDEEDLQRVR